MTGGFGLTVPRTGRRGAPKLVAGLVPPQCLAQLAHAGGRGPKTNPTKKKSINLDEKGAQVDASGSSDSISPPNLMAK